MKPITTGDLGELFGSLGGIGTRYLVIYDGACGICIASVKFLKRIDVLHKFSYITLQEFNRSGSARIPLELLQESIHVLDMDERKVYRSMRGVSLLLANSPPAFPLFLITALLGILGISEQVYAWISRSRYTISGLL